VPVDWLAPAVTQASTENSDGRIAMRPYSCVDAMTGAIVVILRADTQVRPYRHAVPTASHIKVLAGGAGPLGVGPARAGDTSSLINTAHTLSSLSPCAERLLSRSGFPVAFSAPLLILCRKILDHLFWLRPQAAFCKNALPGNSSSCLLCGLRCELLIPS